ncbi:NAD(P)-binding oxidoreductase [Lysinibacillus yapensis]|uniref:NAD(P)-binding oxidoreductase n=1 Tax=Ureibacillus yapensis TaxID=2304605 RepID=UPI0013142385|nr:NAD(P)-binding oxidoreductase [Lysinibacillus yapensis]
MNIVVIGANGQIGRYLIKYLTESGQHKVKALVHNTAQSAYFGQLGIESFVLHSTQSLDGFVNWIKGIDVFVFAGSIEGEDREGSILTEVDSTIRLFEAIIFAKGKRVIYVSTIDIGKENWPRFPEFYRPLLVKNHHIVQWVRNSDLDYTIIQTGNLSDCRGTGYIKIVELDAVKGEISYEDTAKAILQCIETNATIKREFKIVTGKLPIADAIMESGISNL